jgi:hypothetical protein
MAYYGIGPDGTPRTIGEAAAYYGAGSGGGGDDGLWDQLLGGFRQDYNNLVGSENDWYGRQGGATGIMTSGLEDYLDQGQALTSDYRSGANQYQNVIDNIAGGMEGSVRGFGDALSGNIGGMLDNYSGQMEDLYNRNMGAIGNYLDVVPQFEQLQGRFGAAFDRSQAISDRAMDRGEYWANRLENLGEASRSRLHNLGVQAQNNMAGYAANVEEGATRLQNRVDEADEFGARMEERSIRLWDEFQQYQEKQESKAEDYVKRMNTWGGKAVAYAEQARANAGMEIVAATVARNEASQQQFADMESAIMSADLPESVRQSQLTQLNQQAAATYMRQGVENHNAAQQTLFGMDMAVANLMSKAGEIESATTGMFLNTQNTLITMGSFVMNNGQQGLSNVAQAAYSMGTNAAMAAEDITANAAQIRVSGEQIRMHYESAGEDAALQGAVAGAQTEVSLMQQANVAMANANTALQGQLQAVYGESSVLQNAAQLTIQANEQQAQWYQHASNLAAQSHFVAHNSNIQAALQAATIRSNAEGNIYAGEGNIYGSQMRANEVALNQVNLIAQHHSSYRYNPTSLADVFLGMMNAEAASFAAWDQSLTDFPAVGGPPIGGGGFFG